MVSFLQKARSKGVRGQEGWNRTALGKGMACDLGHKANGCSTFGIRIGPGAGVEPPGSGQGAHVRARIS